MGLKLHLIITMHSNIVLIHRTRHESCGEIIQFVVKSVCEDYQLFSILNHQVMTKFGNCNCIQLFLFYYL